MFEHALTQPARELLDFFRQAGLKITTAESCTGGLVAALLTSFPGSSDVLERGFVTYSNAAKAEALGVDARLIAREGAVSELVARAMAEGALARSHADVAVAITGIAGPGGGSDAKPVGLVHVAGSRRGAGTLHERHHFSGSRDEVREKSVLAALKLALKLAQGPLSA